MFQPQKKIYIKTAEELIKKRFSLFGYEIHMPKAEFNKVTTQIRDSILFQGNCYEIDEDYSYAVHEHIPIVSKDRK